MDILLEKANIPDDESMYIGKLVDEPFLSEVMGRHYSLHVRPQWPCPAGVRFGVGEVILASAERVPVHVIGFERVTPHPDAVRSGFWKPSDTFFSIQDTDLTPEQAEQARYFVQAVPTSSTDQTAH